MDVEWDSHYNLLYQTPYTFLEKPIGVSECNGDSIERNHIVSTYFWYGKFIILCSIHSQQLGPILFFLELMSYDNLFLQGFLRYLFLLPIYTFLLPVFSLGSYNFCKKDTVLKRIPYWMRI